MKTLIFWLNHSPITLIRLPQFIVSKLVGSHFPTFKNYSYKEGNNWQRLVKFLFIKDYLIEQWVVLQAEQLQTLRSINLLILLGFIYSMNRNSTDLWKRLSSLTMILQIRPKMD